MAKVTFLGLGVMGYPMARHIAKAGHDVTVYNRTTAKAEKWVKGIVAVPEEGEVYDGKVKSITSFGAFVEFMPGKEGLLHISEIKWERLENMDGVLETGEDIKVKLIGTDRKSGKYRLSRKVLLPRPERQPKD